MVIWQNSHKGLGRVTIEILKNSAGILMFNKQCSIILIGKFQKRRLGENRLEGGLRRGSQGGSPTVEGKQEANLRGRGGGRSRMVGGSQEMVAHRRWQGEGDPRRRDSREGGPSERADRRMTPGGGAGGPGGRGAAGKRKGR